MSDYDPSDRRSTHRYKVDAGRLWAGGGATAVVAALVAVVGILIARGIANVAILAPKGSGVWGNANTVTYALVSAAVGLLATGLMHLLTVSTPSAPQFFSWIMVLCTLIAVVIPASLSVTWQSRVATALLNLLIGIAITILVTSMAANATRRYRRRHTQPTQHQPPYADYPGDETRRWDY